MITRKEAKEKILKIEELIMYAERIKNELHSSFYFNRQLADIDMSLLSDFDDFMLNDMTFRTLKYFDCKTFEEIEEKYGYTVNLKKKECDQYLLFDDIPTTFEDYAVHTKEGLFLDPIHVLDVLQTAYLCNELSHEEMLQFLNKILYESHKESNTRYKLTSLNEAFYEFAEEINKQIER